MTLSELQQQAHALAREKGWWDHARDPDEVFANFHAEISEAWEEYRSGEPITEVRFFRDSVQSVDVDMSQPQSPNYLLMPSLPAHYKPTGFFVELADLVIRIADAAQAWGMTLVAATPMTDFRSVASFVMHAHEEVCHAWDAFKGNLRGDSRYHLQNVVDCCFAFAQQHGVELFKVIELKQAYNRTRPYKHSRIA